MPVFPCDTINHDTLNEEEEEENRTRIGGIVIDPLAPHHLTWKGSRRSVLSLILFKKYVFNTVRKKMLISLF